jgi:hypothetical protein
VSGLSRSALGPGVEGSGGGPPFRSARGDGKARVESRASRPRLRAGAAFLQDRVVELRRELVGDEEGLEAIAAMRRGGGGPMSRLRQGRARPRRR